MSTPFNLNPNQVIGTAMQFGKMFNGGGAQQSQREMQMQQQMQYSREREMRLQQENQQLQNQLRNNQMNPGMNGPSRVAAPTSVTSKAGMKCMETVDPSTGEQLMVCRNPQKANTRNSVNNNIFQGQNMSTGVDDYMPSMSRGRTR